MDTIVFDIETQNFFTDPGVGRDNFAALKISVVGAYSYVQDRYFTFEEYQIGECIDLFRDAERIVGFSSNRYDIPVLNLYFERFHPVLLADRRFKKVDLWGKNRIDLLDEIEMATGHRISLDRLAEANLGTTKTHHSWEAIALYKEGKMGELKEYCLNDVRLTKELYDLYRNEHELLIPDKETGKIQKVVFPKQAERMP
jgi:DEAD/DEAH box helicase domain-containing protein